MRASLKLDLLNKTLLLQRITEGGIAWEIARMAYLGLPQPGSPLGLNLRPAEFVPVLKYRPPCHPGLHHGRLLSSLPKAKRKYGRLVTPWDAPRLVTELRGITC